MNIELKEQWNKVVTDAVIGMVQQLVKAGLSTLALGYYMRLLAAKEGNVVLLGSGSPEELERAFGLTREQRLECERELAAHGLARIEHVKRQ